MKKIRGSNNSNNKGKNEGRQSRRENKSEGIDYISHLPEAIILHIHSFLPLKELVAVSFLSRLWKSMVLALISMVPSNLNLDEIKMMGKYVCRREICYRKYGDGYTPDSAHQCLCHSVQAARRKFEEFVDRTLLLHTGCTIEKLRLSICYDQNMPLKNSSETYDAHSEYTKRIDKWVQFAFKNNIKNLELDFSKGKMFEPTGWDKIYDMPHGNFAPKNLKNFILNYCKLSPSIFVVFGSLQTLSFKQVKICGCSVLTIGELVAKCPTLEDLSLEYCIIPNDFMVSDQDMKIKRLSLINSKTDEWPMFPIEISTPDLLMLTMVGVYLMNSTVQKALNLANVVIDIKQKYGDHIQGDALGLLLTSLKHCQTLALSTWCIQNALQDFIPNIFDFEENSYWQSQNLPYKCLQHSLKKVEVNGFVGRSNEMKMIQFLLENARVLEKMVISFIGRNAFAASTQQQQNNYMQLQNNSLQLLNFPRASSQAQIEIFGNPYNNTM